MLDGKDFDQRMNEYAIKLRIEMNQLYADMLEAYLDDTITSSVYKRIVASCERRIAVIKTELQAIDEGESE